MLALALALSAIAYLDRARISMAAPALKAELHISDTQMGWVFSAFTIGYALFEIPSGWLADRFGARATLARIVVAWSIMSALTGLAGGFISLLLIRFLFGLGEAGTFPGLSRVFVRWLNPREHGRAFGLALMTGALAGAVSQPLTGWLVGLVGWRALFPLCSVVGLLWAIVWLVWFRNDPHDHPSVNAAELAQIGTAAAAPATPVPWRALLRNRNIIALCVVCGSSLYGWYIWLTWLPSYLIRAHGFDLRKAGWLAACPLLASAIAVLVGGWASDVLVARWGARIGRTILALVGLPLAVAAIVFATQVTSPIACVILLSLAAALAAGAQTPMFAICVQIGGKNAGVVTGIVNMAGNLFAVFGPVIVGGIVQHYGSWNLALLTVAFFYGVAGLSWLAINPTAPINGQAQRG